MGVYAGTPENSAGIRQGQGFRSLPQSDTVSRPHLATVGPVLIAALGMRLRLSGNNSFPHSIASTGFAILPEKSGLPAYIPTEPQTPNFAKTFAPGTIAQKLRNMRQH
jgi:hypothetical protein